MWTLSGFADEAGKTTDEQITATRRAGFKHVDLRTIEDFNITQLPQQVAQTVAAKLKDAGISVCMFGSPIGKIDLADDFQIDVDKLDHLGKLAPIFNCNQVRIFSYYNSKDKQPDDAWQTESLRRLAALKQQAGKLGLVLYHENELNIWGDCCRKVQIMAEQLRDSKTFKLIFDFDNYHQSGDDVWANWQTLADVTDAFHLKDSDAQNQHVPVGQGAGCVKQILTDAVKRRWGGQLILEPHLQRSAAVVATGPSGQANQAFANMTPPDCYHAAATAAIDLLKQVNAPIG